MNHPIPTKADRIQHRKTRSPIAIAAVLKSRKTGEIKLRLETGETIPYPHPDWELYQAPVAGDWVQVYMWQQVSQYQHLAWNGHEVLVLSISDQSAIVSHPDWPEPLRGEGVEVPFSAIKQHPSCELRQAIQAEAVQIWVENEWRQHPQTADRVILRLGLYEQWYGATVAAMPSQFNGKRTVYSKRDQHWIDRYMPENIPPAEIFTVKQIQDDLALIRANGENYKVSVNCLEVLERRSEEKAAA